MSGSTVNIEDKIELKEIFNHILKLEDEHELLRFGDKVREILNDDERIKKLKESATEKDWDLVVKTLRDKKSPLTKRVFAAELLAVIGSEAHEGVLRNYLFDEEVKEIRDEIFWMLLWPIGMFPIAPRLKMIFEFVDKRLSSERDYLKFYEKEIGEKGLTQDLLTAIDEKGYYWEIEQTRFKEDIAVRLRALSMNREYKAEFALYRRYFVRLLEDHLNLPFVMQNINYDVSVNAAKILYSIGLRQDIVDVIRPCLEQNSRCVYLAGEYGEPSFIRILAKQLEVTDEKPADPFAWYIYCNVIIDALGELGIRFSSKKEFEAELIAAVEPLCKMLCDNIKDENLSLKLLRAIENIQGKIRTAEYVVSKIMEAEDVDDCGYLDILVLLKDKNAAFAKLESYFFKGKMEEKRKAEIAIQRMGLSQAVDLLVTEELSGYYSKYIGEPMKEVETESLNILRRTVKQVESTYKVNTGMSVTVFIVGIIVIFIGAMLVLTGTTDVTQLFGGASVVGGIITTLTSFAKGPISSVQNAVADLAQVETAFLLYVRSTGLASFAFLREFLKKENPDINILEKCTQKMNEVAKATMLLIEVYGGGKNETINGLLGEKKNELAKAIMATPIEPKTPTTTTTSDESTTENPK